MTSYSEYRSPLGVLLLAASERGLSGLYFEQHKYFKGTQDWRRDDAHDHLVRTKKQLDEYFAGQRQVFDLALDLRGTPFQRAVWDALALLPFGLTSTYQSIAQRVASPKAVRAVGTAIGRNPVSIIVPCHRVLGSSGALSGYAGGLDRKRYLLALEEKNYRGAETAMPAAADFFTGGQRQLLLQE
jgi:methylated-DNA-[protein]-cysteine S-methyltransferase